MKIISYDSYLDGGTIKLETDKGTYYIDGRIDTMRSEKPNEIYDKYPDDEGAKVVSAEIKEEIKQVLKYSHDQYLSGQAWLKEKFGFGE